MRFCYSVQLGATRCNSVHLRYSLPKSTLNFPFLLTYMHLNGICVLAKGILFRGKALIVIKFVVKSNFTFYFLTFQVLKYMKKILMLPDSKC